MTTDDPHFDGPVLSGGFGWPVGDVTRTSEPEPLAAAAGGPGARLGPIRSGELWAVAGPAGVGVTELLVRVAADVGASRSVLWANGHHPSRPLARRALDAAGAEPDVRLTSWLRAPWAGEEWDGACSSADLLLLDTWDEMWRPAGWERTTEQRLADLRWLRELARRHETAVVITARTHHANWHPCSGLFDDLADVLVTVAWPESGRARHLTCRRRGTGWSSGELQPG